MSQLVNCRLKAVIYVTRPRPKQRLHVGHWLYVLRAPVLPVWGSLRRRLGLDRPGEPVTRPRCFVIWLQALLSLCLFQSRIASRKRRLPFTILPLKHLSDVPKCVVFVGIAGLPLWEVEFVAVEAQWPFVEADGTVSATSAKEYPQFATKTDRDWT